MSSWPCSFKIAAAADESTPPDIATAIFILGTHASGVPFALTTYDRLPIAIDHNRHAGGVRTQDKLCLNAPSKNTESQKNHIICLSIMRSICSKPRLPR